MATWAFSLRTSNYADYSSDDDELDTPAADKLSDDAAFLYDIDLSSRQETVQYKPNPWSIAKVNAACRPNAACKPESNTNPKPPPKAPAKPTGRIVDGFKRQAERFRPVATKTRRLMPQKDLTERNPATSGPSNVPSTIAPRSTGLPVAQESQPTRKVAQNLQQDGYTSPPSSSRFAQPGSHVFELSRPHIPTTPPVAAYPAAFVSGAPVAPGHANIPHSFPHSFSSPGQSFDRNYSSHAFSNSSPARPSYGNSAATYRAGSGQRNQTLTPLLRKHAPVQMFLPSRPRHSPVNTNAQVAPCLQSGRSRPATPLHQERHQQNTYNTLGSGLDINNISPFIGSHLHHQTSPQSLSSPTCIENPYESDDRTEIPRWLATTLSQSIQPPIPPPDPELSEDHFDAGPVLPPSSPLPELGYSPMPAPNHGNAITGRPETHQTSTPSISYLPNPYKRPTAPSPRQAAGHSPTLRGDAYQSHVFQDSDPDSTWSTFPVRKKAKTGGTKSKTAVKTSRPFALPIGLGGKDKTNMRDNEERKEVREIRRRVVTYLPPPMVRRMTELDKVKSAPGAKETQVDDESESSPATGTEMEESSTAGSTLVNDNAQRVVPMESKCAHDYNADESDVTVRLDVTGIETRYAVVRRGMKDRKYASARLWCLLDLPSCGVIYRDEGDPGGIGELPIVVWGE